MPEGEIDRPWKGAIRRGDLLKGLAGFVVGGFLAWAGYLLLVPLHVLHRR